MLILLFFFLILFVTLYGIICERNEVIVIFITKTKYRIRLIQTIKCYEMLKIKNVKHKIFFLQVSYCFTCSAGD